MDVPIIPKGPLNDSNLDNDDDNDENIIIGPTE